MHALPDEQRQNFLRNIPYHRQIIEALIALHQQMLGLDQDASNLTTPPQPAAVPVVDLQNASLRGARLIGATLSRVSLAGAD